MNSMLNADVIRNTLSQPRLSTYEKYTVTLDEALELYQWNANISGAFFPCLHICEVTIRNAVSEVLFKQHGSQWPWETGFINTLPNPRHGYNPRNNVQKARDKVSDVNKVIPELNFVFWQKMFTSRHDDQLWLPYLRDTFPYAPSYSDIAALRSEIYNDLEKIRRLRNRIAHHEPIFRRDLNKDYEVIIKLIGYRCCDTAQWLCSHQNVVSLLNDKPR